MRKRRLVLLLALVVVLLPATIASAGAPVKLDLALQNTGTITDLCSFPVDLEASSTVAETVFFDNAGNLLRAQFHTVVNVTFSANGNSLASAPYTYNGDMFFDSFGNVTQSDVSGVVVKVPLPDGTLFIGAGRVDVLAHPPTAFPLVPDRGASHNLEGFCAALAAP